MQPFDKKQLLHESIGYILEADLLEEMDGLRARLGRGGG